MMWTFQKDTLFLFHCIRRHFNALEVRPRDAARTDSFGLERNWRAASVSLLDRGVRSHSVHPAPNTLGAAEPGSTFQRDIYLPLTHSAIRVYFAVWEDGEA